MSKPLDKLTLDEALDELGGLRERFKGNEYQAPKRVRELSLLVRRQRILARLAIAAVAILLTIAGVCIALIILGNRWAFFGVLALPFLFGFGYSAFQVSHQLTANRNFLNEWQEALIRVNARVNPEPLFELNIYRVRVQDIIDDLRRRANRARRVHNSLQVVIIVGSIAVTSLSSIGLSLTPVRWANIGVAATVSVAAGLSGFFKFRERSFNQQRTADAIEKELNQLELGVGRYSIKRIDALKLFATVVEELREEQRKVELQLDQTTESQGRGSGEATKP